MSTIRISITLVLLIIMSCKDSNPNSKKEMQVAPDVDSVMETSFYTGTYTDGDSEGIYKFTLQPDGTLKSLGLMAEAENPSFLAWSADKRYLLAVNEVSNENGQGYVSSFKAGKDTLVFADQKSSGGAHPCHIAVNPEGYVVVANYSGGNMGLLHLQDGGRLSELLDVRQHNGRGTHPRQDAPHAHSGWFTADGGVMAVDLGTNQLWLSEIDPQSQKFIPGVPDTFSMEAGAGPRHLAFHPQNHWIYVINELNSTVSVIAVDDKGIPKQIIQTISTLPETFAGINTTADIHISADGKFLYASNRGHNSIAVYAIDRASGKLQILEHERTRGETPRNFSISPDNRFLLVANQTTNSIVSFARNNASGLLTFIDQIEAPTPVCILFE